MKEKLEHLICEKGSEPENVQSPLLVYEGKIFPEGEETNYWVMAESAVIAELLELIQGIECLLATYYVFNMSYPKEISNTLSFLQKAILNLTDKAPTPRNVVSLVTKLALKK